MVQTHVNPPAWLTRSRKGWERVNGTLAISRELSVGYFEQTAVSGSQLTVYQEARSRMDRVNAAEKALRATLNMVQMTPEDLAKVQVVPAVVGFVGIFVNLAMFFATHSAGWLAGTAMRGGAALEAAGVQGAVCRRAQALVLCLAEVFGCPVKYRTG